MKLLAAALAGLVGLGPAVALGQTSAPDAIAQKAAACETCHGAQGVPSSDGVPVIWGQHAGYLFLELRDYKTGARNNPIMAPIASGLSREEMLSLGEYFEKKPWPDLDQPNASSEAAARATSVASSGQCTQCHLGGFMGDSTTPRLAGQSVEYLLATMKAFHDGSRGNNPWMAALLKTYSDQDIEALAQFLGGLAPSR